MASQSYRGHLRKMTARLESPISYNLTFTDEEIPLNPFIGQSIRLSYTGHIACIHCSRKTSKSFSQGYCYPCFQSLAQCDSCIIKPELCHYDRGTCREPAWAENFCMADHVVYLANSSGVKVGITRATQIPTRWIDQGAIQALPILRVDTRYRSGLVEDLFKSDLADKTNWRAMLKGDVSAVDLEAVRDEVLDKFTDDLEELREQYGLQAWQPIDNPEVIEINYPVKTYPTTIKSHNFDKTPEVMGVLEGIKGQYLILDTGVINLRKFGGYEIEFVAE